MSHSTTTTTTSEQSDLANELACYLQSGAGEIDFATMSAIECKYDAHYNARQYLYQLPSGQLSLLEMVLYLPSDTSSADIETIRLTTLKTAMTWHKTYASQKKANDIASHDVLVVDIHFTEEAQTSTKHIKGNKNISAQRVKHGFGARYFMERLVVDTEDSVQQLQIFSWHDWHTILDEVQTPGELWRFLCHHVVQLDNSANSQIPSFDTEEALVSQFLRSPSLLTPAIAVDNALVKYSIQDEPNPALVAMTLAYRNKSTTAQMYRQHLQQAAALWSQLSMQMIETFGEKQLGNDDKTSLVMEPVYWQRQLLDESLFSRHELIRTLYRHPKQGQKLQQSGYVVHQHSYESLGRHYVLIFYGQDPEGQHGKRAIQPNLAKIAQDVAVRLPIAELHHVIVMGIDFITEVDDTFIDIDLWIQPVEAMTQRERQLTKQLQQLKRQAQK